MSITRGSLAAALGLLLLSAPASAQTGDREFMARLVARTFFRGLIAGGTASIVPLCARRLNLEGQWVSGREAIGERLKAMARRAREQGLQLRRIEVISYREAVRRFGPPPERLRGAVGPGRMVALARLNRLGAVAVLQRAGAFWKVAALTD